MRRLLSSLKIRFLIAYLMLAILPLLFFNLFVYMHAVDTAQREIVVAQTKAAYSKRQYIQYLLQSIEDKYDRFASCSELREILDGTVATRRTIMYNYVSVIPALINGALRETSAIESIGFYSKNAVAADILPGFHALEDLDESAFPENYSSNPTRVLFQQFWCVEQRNGVPVLTFYAGLLDNQYRHLDGVLVIRCKQSIWELLLFDSEDSPSCLFMNGHLVYSSGFEDPPALQPQFGDDEDLNVYIDDSEQIVSRINLSNYHMTIYKSSALQRHIILPNYFYLAILLFLAMSFIPAFVVIHPLKRIAGLARHMKSTQSIPLQPFPLKSNASEIKDIISEYNALVQRVNDLSQNINQKELLLRKAQIERLQSQLNPHFFYGTLESIRMIAEIHEQPEIAEIAYDFASLMRYSLSRSFFVPLAQEIGIVRQYVAIQQKRIGNRFSFDWDIQVSVEDWKCPKFILFSLVENAFTHDVNNSRSVVHIAVSLWENGDRLSFSVVNDGPGIEAERLRLIRKLIDHPEQRQSFTSQNNGRSIFNINDRLRFYYGDDFTFRIDSEPEVRTVCEISIDRNARSLGEEEDHAEDPAD